MALDSLKGFIRPVAAALLVASTTFVVVPFQLPIASAIPSGYIEKTIASSTGKCNTKVEIPSVSSALSNIDVVEDGAFCVVIDKHLNANTNLAIRWVKPAGVNSIEYLVVGGGGFGGTSNAGGGGAGGEVVAKPLSVAAHSVLSFSVGRGSYSNGNAGTAEYSCIRSGNNDDKGTACSDPATNPSVLVRAAPGSNANTAVNFGAGGGYGKSTGGWTVAAPSRGFSGGAGNTVAGGGGAGACGAGGNATSSSGGSGGDGCPSSITGSLAYYGVGGGGGALCTGCTGGSSPNGGGAGATSISKVGSSPTAPNYGGGGGGNSNSSTTVPGGNGVVIIRYAMISPPAWTDDSISFGTACSRITNDGVSAAGTPTPQYEVLSGGVLPSGLTFKSDGSGFNGSISVPGSYDFTIRAWNSAGSIQKRFTGTIQPCANISIASITYSNPTPVPGEEIDMDIVLANRAGPDVAPNSKFTYRVPDLVDATPVGFICTGSGTLICDAGNIQVSPQSSSLDKKLKFKLTVRSSYPGGTTSNGLCSVASDAIDGELSNNSTTCNFQPSAARADLKVEALNLTGEKTTYAQNSTGSRSFRVANLGPSDAASPTFVFTVNPSNIKPRSNASVTFSSPTTGSGQWSCGTPSGTNPTTITCQSSTSMKSGSSIDISVPTESDNSANGTQVSSTATVSTQTSDPVSGNNSISSMLMFVDLRPDLSVAAQFNLDSVEPGGVNVLKIRVSNAGSVSSSGPTTVSFTLPSGLTLGSGRDVPALCTASGSSVTCYSSSGLAVGGSMEFLMNIDVNSVAISGTNLSLTATTAAASSSDQNATGVETNLWNNSSIATMAVASPRSDLVLAVSRPSSTFAGSTAVVQISVTNNGPSSISGYSLIYDLPLKVSLSGAVPIGCVLVSKTLQCDRLTTFARNATEQFSFTVEVDGSSVAGLTKYGSIAVTSSVVDVNTLNNTATETEANLNVIVPAVTPSSDPPTTTTTTSPPPTTSTIPRTGVAGQTNTQYGLGFLFVGLFLVLFARRRSIEKLR